MSVSPTSRFYPNGDLPSRCTLVYCAAFCRFLKNRRPFTSPIHDLGRPFSRAASFFIVPNNAHTLEPILTGLICTSGSLLQEPLLNKCFWTLLPIFPIGPFRIPLPIELIHPEGDPLVFGLPQFPKRITICHPNFFHDVPTVGILDIVRRRNIRKAILFQPLCHSSRRL